MAAWVIDVAFTSITFTAGDLNSLASGGGALGTTVIANSTGLDTYMDASFVITVGGTTLATSYFGLYVLPLNQDGTTYGDGYASSTTTQPGLNYREATCAPKVGVTTGNTVTGIFTFIRLPPGDVKLALGQNLGVALAATAAITLKYRTYNIV